MTYAPVVGHCDELLDALGPFRRSAALAGHWGERLAAVLCGGGRLLAAGNGGSAAQAQHLTAELVGRYRTDRPPFSAIALHADTSSTTAIANDYGVGELFARQVRAHGRPGDLLILLSTSGASANLLSAADAGRAAGLHVWALTGPAPNPLAAAADEAFCVDAPSTATVQELHLVAVHMVCEAFDDALEAGGLLRAGPTTTHGTGIARSLSTRGTATNGTARRGGTGGSARGGGAGDGSGRVAAVDGTPRTGGGGPASAPRGGASARDGARRLDGAGRLGRARTDGNPRPGGGPADDAPRPDGAPPSDRGRAAPAPRGGTGRHRAVPEDGTGRKERRDG
jgi:D-sedoheptulose 7-phosphate isomerase